MCRLFGYNILVIYDGSSGGFNRLHNVVLVVDLTNFTMWVYENGYVDVKCDY